MWCVLVYCGFSEWFGVDDMRVVGPMSETEARSYKEGLDDRAVERRDGFGQVVVVAMPMLDTPTQEFAV